MMWIIGILTVFLILDCLFLMLLVLVQLPKKEAGMGQAFGGAATDALFGAGSGNALTKMTKYATVVFFVLTLGLTLLNAKQARQRGTGKLEKTLQEVREAPATLPPGPVKQSDSSVVPTNMPGTAPATTNAPSTNQPLITPAPAPAPTPTPAQQK